eukprot:TRINITY_DN37576_c0_g1_i1.p1 TRINITY_DN37576_c0_g1~~TRINITY_DN37576_c0_g1_i1.p1  ORF type:complete len:233 (+),score=24.89 TRINITY_DN37576_c0_g1_i1:18-716(+)
MQQFLRTTPIINHQHPTIVNTAQKICEGYNSNIDKAVAIHDFVRDKIKFGWHRNFYAQRASDVVDAGIGFCNTKSTLFTALLRSQNIPARIHYVDINSQVLRGFVEPTPYVDHSYTEVFLNDKWVKVDSYVVDKKLAENGRKKLKEEGGKLGYGVILSGQSEWNGKDEAFSQFKNDGTYPNLTTQDYGVFDDYADFYKQTRKTWNGDWVTRLVFLFFTGSLNSNVEKIRALQ